MDCVKRNCVYALFGAFITLSTFPVTGKDKSSINAATVKEQFQWNEHTTLSWDDFRGAVNASHDESAAATYCSIGFKTNTPVAGGKPEVTVYNTFYANRSWVRSDARIGSILIHEQGHFDLCEVYTRQLKDRIGGLDLSTPGMKQELMRIYAELSSEYEMRQQAYEQETLHGTNITEQTRWQKMIATELAYNAVVS